MKKIYLLAAAAITLASCTNDDFIGENGQGANGERPISFNLETAAITRATGSDAASALNNQFILWGEKNETASTAKAALTAANTVMQNYTVNYRTTGANSTTTNTKGWEYVGESTYSSNVSPVASNSAPQTIKYWDYGASSYTFTAVSAKHDDISNGYVKITKITKGSSDEKDKGYTLTLSTNASVDSIYLSNRLNIAKTSSTSGAKYGDPVTLNFRSLISKIRVGMYETIPGYKVKIDKFYYMNSDSPTFANMTTAATDGQTTPSNIFGANVPNAKSGTAATLTITYDANNNPKVATSMTAANFITLGGQINAATALATTSSSPTYDQTSGTFTNVFPQESNEKSMKIKVDYTLTSEDTGETITVTGATAEIPAKYLQWKSNYTYTYILKISDNTNGTTGGSGDPVGLYPLTFDAATIVSGDGISETITNASDPTITTFGVKDSKYVSGGGDYKTGTDIYATIMKGSTVITPVLSGSVNVKIYKLTSTGTEADIANWVAHTVSSKYSDVSTDASTNFTAAPAAVTTVPAENGGTATINAVKLTGVKTGTYAIEYTESSNKYYRVFTVVD